MRVVHDSLRRAARSRSTVLVRGESGTGKELAARRLHAMGGHPTAPFVKVHCAALPDTLFESELFGYERGAFTGATSRKPGRVELARGGTLFIDEVGDVSLFMQVKLLRLLQDREFERLGGITTLKTDVRFVAATHRNLEEMVERGSFRQDLFYRLNVVTVWLPPLRARRGDIGTLARLFCERYAALSDRPGVSLGDDAIEVLRAQRWTGNVRELENFIERLVVMSPGGVIGRQEVERELSPPAPFSTETTGAAKPAVLPNIEAPARVEDASLPLQEELRRAERVALLRALDQSRGNRTRAARLLGISRATLYNKLGEHGLDVEAGVPNV